MGIESRPRFYEPFGGKCYYGGRTFELDVMQAGTYDAVYWDPLAMGDSVRRATRRPPRLTGERHAHGSGSTRGAGAARSARRGDRRAS